MYVYKYIYIYIYIYICMYVYICMCVLLVPLSSIHIIQLNLVLPLQFLAAHGGMWRRLFEEERRVKPVLAVAELDYRAEGIPHCQHTSHVSIRGGTWRPKPIFAVAALDCRAQGITRCTHRTSLLVHKYLLADTHVLQKYKYLLTGTYTYYHTRTTILPKYKIGLQSHHSA